MPRQTDLQIAEQNLKNQAKFMAERGTTRDAYVTTYARYGRDEADVVAIWDADRGALRRCEDRVEVLRRQASRRAARA